MEKNRLLKIEDLKVNIGCVFPKIQDTEMEIRGRDLGTGLPSTLKVRSSEMLEALIETALMIVDAVIITSSYLVYQSVETIAYGFVTLSITAYAIDMLITGDKQSVQFLIITKEYQKLADAIIHDANRGVTVLNGTGGFSGNDVKVLMVMARKNESTRILKLVQDIDPDAFLTMGNVMGVYGQGFDKIRI